MERKIRVLVAKPGLDGHDRGALVIAQALRDEGMEVVYTGLRQTPAQIVASAIQEDVNVIGLSCLSGAHNELFPEVIRLLKEQGADDIIVIGGGVIPDEDIPFLEEQGVVKVFTPGTKTKDTADFIRHKVSEKQGAAESIMSSPEKIEHIGIAVKNLDESVKFYTKMLGLKLLGFETVESEQVRVAFLEIGETHIELLEPTSEDSAIAKFIAKKGEGIHHIALKVDDQKERLNKLKEAGVRLISEEPKLGAHQNMVAFLHPKSTHGVLLELCQKVDTPMLSDHTDKQ
ncbi:methylmalonyl-CoA epimerase [Aneurinibacillus aneurinilyticus]|jgi:methylmalonyl-CoA mutase C-terminal domain/subunit|uniref:Methylmalonyl-CoA epimerase n=2 Tax=Aneurinibacillus aneurinilyticus TaxID=1391 RepID=A0A848CU56_ANEAE|nr:methylmalonyl-CoA epimerase [Aneurinibacillus aneurinilyticus]ERI05922.1 methylmalonyl-CoA epimerase [Aneurinibacillus aneurinilyticus ATCC 12856]MCI1692674.1 methylmalonyl-CoA epimerase [Aneurinibacillus aneurinilyticus]MED0672737.1 methylmalonyl-CoA epimerase [Aneurinibacillus aneurinilyticus]MED0708564.1 methylmalonyl-CoA epimerase [Aneurinibacillus aneurinilyticus]MED0721724.1 methylmalonyl-CoA epimerase [Aneurinibacillus aneurinilyticus]